MKRLTLLIFLLGVTGLSFASGNDDDDSDSGPCSHPHFVTYDCLDSYGYDSGEDGTNGTNGVDGLDGIDGINGFNGIDGLNGLDGADGATGPMGPAGPVGPSGASGKDFTQFLREARGLAKSYGQYMAATQAAQVYLPQDKRSRLTFGISRVRGNTGLGIGYALKLDDEDRTAFTLSLGVSGGETVGNASVGFEF